MLSKNWTESGLNPCREQESRSDWFADFEEGNFSLVKEKGKQKNFLSKQEYWAPVLLLT